jgi:hypothetical protein
VINNFKNFAERPSVLRITTFAVLTVLAITAARQVHAEEGRIQITFFKAGDGSGSGYLFFQGHKYGVSISSTKIRRVWVTTIDLIGTASNLRKAADIIGTYTGADDQAATLRRSKVARLQNENHKESRLGTIFGIVAAFADWLGFFQPFEMAFSKRRLPIQSCECVDHRYQQKLRQEEVGQEIGRRLKPIPIQPITNCGGCSCPKRVAHQSSNKEGNGQERNR